MTTRRVRCGLCREYGHNYRTCARVDVIHEELIGTFRRFILDHRLETVEEGMYQPMGWLQDYSITAFRALAKKHGFATTHSKLEYMAMYKQLYLTIAFHDIQMRLHSFLLRDTLMQLAVLQEERRWVEAIVDSGMLRLSIDLFSIEYLPNEKPSQPLEECPICYDCVTPDRQIELNCDHVYCNGCMATYFANLRKNLDDLQSMEECTPKCPLCRKMITKMMGDVDFMNEHIKSCLTFD